MPIPGPQPEGNDPAPLTDPVEVWRLRVYLELGVPLEDAENLAGRSDVDWHVLKRLLERGCDIETAIRIVA